MRLALLALLLTACTVHTGYEGYLERRGITAAQTPERYDHCHGYGCKHISSVTLVMEDWRKIKTVMTPTQSPGKERINLAKAIGLFEKISGAQTGTHVDIRGTFKKLGNKQLDCVDESTNTTIYLMLLEQKGLLRHHYILPPDVRVPLIHAGRWPHQTAVIAEKETGERFAVDSWFHDNGAAAEVIPLKQWKEGWKPASL